MRKPHIKQHTYFKEYLQIIPLNICLVIFLVQEASTSALASIAAVVDRETKETASGSLESLASTTCGALGNLLGASSEKAAVNQANISNQGVEQQSATENKQAKVHCVYFNNS